MPTLLDEIDYSIDNDPSPLNDYEEDMSFERPTLTERVVKVESDIREILVLLKEKKRPDTVAQWTLAATILAVVVAYFAWWQPNHENNNNLQIDSRIDAKLKDGGFDDLAKNVNELRGQVSEISALDKIIIAKLLKQDASLPLSQFKENLETLGTALDAAKAQNVQLDTRTVSDIQSKLRIAATTSAGYWQTVGSFVTYKSAVGPSSTTGVLPSCWSTYKGHWEDDLKPKHGESIVDDQTFGNCTLTLDDGPIFRDSGFGKQYALNLIKVPNLELRINMHDGVVLYHGGQLIPYKELNCLRCTYRVDAAQTPPAHGQRVVKILLASGGKMDNISIPGS